MNPFAVDGDIKLPMVAPAPTTAVYVNFYQIPGSPIKTSSVHNTRKLADAVWNPPVGGWRVSTKRRIACIRVEAVCIDGQFDN